MKRRKHTSSPSHHKPSKRHLNTYGQPSSSDPKNESGSTSHARRRASRASILQQSMGKLHGEGETGKEPNLVQEHEDSNNPLQVAIKLPLPVSETDNKKHYPLSKLSKLFDTFGEGNGQGMLDDTSVDCYQAKCIELEENIKQMNLELDLVIPLRII